MAEQDVSDRIAEPELCGLSSGWGAIRRCGCVHLNGHAGPHKNDNGYEWHDRMSQVNKERDDLRQIDREQDALISRLREENARLKTALGQIADPYSPEPNGVCTCAHDDANCCALNDYWCPMCIAAQALKPIAAPST